MFDSLEAFARDLSRLIAGGGAFPPFETLALPLHRLQLGANPGYRRWCEVRGTAVGEAGDWRQIPAIPTRAFKELELTALPAGRRTAEFRSSGTTRQQPSRHYHDATSLALYRESLLAWFGQHFPPLESTTCEPADRGRHGGWIILTPPPAAAPHSSLVHMLDTVSRRFGGSDFEFTGRIDGEGVWQLDAVSVLRALEKNFASGRTVTLLGTAFHFVHLLEHVAGHELRPRLLGGSRVMETGGYKGRARERSRPELHAEIARVFGVPSECIVGEYGMCELSSQAYDGVCGSVSNERIFRFPPWVRATVISPETGREVAVGEEGLLRVFDLANVWSVMAVQTEDRALRLEGGFQLRGRVPRAEPRGCSLMAAA